MIPNPGTFLGIKKRNAADDELRKAYRDCLFKFHPDRHPLVLRLLANEMFLFVDQAKDVLERDHQGRETENYFSSRVQKSGGSLSLAGSFRSSAIW